MRLLHWLKWSAIWAVVLSALFSLGERSDGEVERSFLQAFIHGFIAFTIIGVILCVIVWTILKMVSYVVSPMIPPAIKQQYQQKLEPTYVEYTYDTMMQVKRGRKTISIPWGDVIPGDIVKFDEGWAPILHKGSLMNRV